MITPMAQAAIAALNDICFTGEEQRMKEYTLSEEQKKELLGKLEAAGLIILTNPEKPQAISSYKPARKSSEISLLNILEATGEHLNCNYPTTEQFYMRYGKAAQKLGVVNHMTRMYLQEIKLYEL